MSWAALFERAGDCAVTEAQVRDQLAEHRAQQGEKAEEGNGE